MALGSNIIGTQGNVARQFAARPALPSPRVPGTFQHYVDPYGVLTEAQLEAQAKAYVQSVIGPQIAAATATSNAQTAKGQAAITGYTQALLPAIKAITDQIGAGYKGAEASSASLADATRAALTGQAAGEGNALTTALGNAGLPTTLGSQVAATGAAAGNTSLASGNATLQGLLASGAAANEYAGKLPNIAFLQGLQASKDYQGKQADALNTLITDLRGKQPGLAQSVFNTLSNANLGRQAKEIAANAKATPKLGTKAGPYYLGQDGQWHLSPNYVQKPDGTIVPYTKPPKPVTPKPPKEIVTVGPDGTTKVVATVPANAVIRNAPGTKPGTKDGPKNVYVLGPDGKLHLVGSVPAGSIIRNKPKAAKAASSSSPLGK